MKPKKKGQDQGWIRQAVVIGVIAVALVFLIPLIFLPGLRDADPAPTATLPVLESAAPASATPAAGYDAAKQIRVLQPDGTVQTMALADYLWGVVAAEMPASFHAEALKAQTVAARTYCLYQLSGAASKHPDADVCTDSACCQAYLTRDQAAAGWKGDAQRYGDKISAAVADTDGLLALYHGQPIDALFFSSAAGRTVDATEVWGSAVPYLTGVTSPEGEEVPGYNTTVTFPVETFKTTFLTAHADANFSGEPASWFQNVVQNSAGGVATMTVGGVSVTGPELRRLYTLRSASFTVGADADTVTFQVTGYGHGVGMSQYGANALAGQGENFEGILKHYYTGIAVGGLAE